MVEIENHSLIQTMSLIALAVIAFSVGLQKLLKEWKSTDAETDVITLMHTELERLSQQNTALSTELGRLHTEVINLSQELQKLTFENQRLQIEVCTLTEEISLFKSISSIQRKGTNATR